MFLEILKSLVCQHEYKMVKMLDAEQLHHFDAISEWQCLKCKRVMYSKYMDKIK